MPKPLLYPPPVVYTGLCVGLEGVTPFPPVAYRPRSYYPTTVESVLATWHDTLLGVGPNRLCYSPAGCRMLLVELATGLPKEALVLPGDVLAVEGLSPYIPLHDEGAGDRLRAYGWRSAPPPPLKRGRGWSWRQKPD